MMMTDSYRSIRTNVVLVWTLTNGALIAGILSTQAGSNITANNGNAVANGYMVSFFLFFLWRGWNDVLMYEMG